MFRCAFAHTPSKPKWMISKYYQKTYTIKEIDFKIDFRDLDGKILEENQHGGLNALFNLMNYCLIVLKEQSNVNTIEN